jgi:hypothetical protein
MRVLHFAYKYKNFKSNCFIHSDVSDKTLFHLTAKLPYIASLISLSTSHLAQQVAYLAVTEVDCVVGRLVDKIQQVVLFSGL